MLVLAWVGLGVPDLAAHRLQEAMTTIVWNPRSSTLEIVHALHQEDALLALEVTGEPVDAAPDALRTRARVALYTARRFELFDAAGGRLHATLLGAQLDGDRYLVFRELSVSSPPAQLRVSDLLLTEPFADPRNQVNYEIGAAIDSLVFTGDRRGGVLEPVTATDAAEENRRGSP